MVKYDTKLNAYTLDKEGIIFIWNEEPTGDFEKEATKISKFYNENLLNIINFMISDIQAMYGDVNTDDVKKKLGRPIIDIENGQVTYCEQKFDDIHIFCFEYLDDKFSELQYFSIDG